ncbi:DUF4360 domain-containing protein [Actinomadura meridiana]|uniref:DUF4360 domain-containing protein n=1 Tax=Actinomadura meridiana TaxID=559626 RepID=UPI0031EAD909
MAAPHLVRGPDGVSVEIVALYGSGCPPGTVGASVQDGSGRLSLYYEGPLAETGGSSKPPDRRKSCTAVLKLNVPKGFTYAISSSANSGYAFLEEGAMATLKVGYSFQNAPSSEITQTLNGPFNDEWWITDHPSPDSITWKPCDEDWNLNFTSDLRAHQGTSDPSKVSYVSMENMNNFPHHLYDLAWKTCP